MNSKLTSEQVVSNFVNTIELANYEQMRQLLAENLVSYITNAKGGVDEVRGRDSYIQRIPKDIGTVKPSIRITQILSIDANQVLVMIEIKAERKDKSMINHAAFLMKVINSQITEMWMVEALPAYSDEFWKK